MKKIDYNFETITSKLLASKQLADWQIKQLISKETTLSECDDEILNKIEARLIQAKVKGEKVFISGDYDCDGICATTIIKDTLDLYGITAGFYIPNRFNEGYGMSRSIVESAHKSGYTLIITVDNGVAASDALAYAHELGIDVIVSDHHVISNPVTCVALLHPTLLKENFQSMCGAAMALLISRKLIGENDRHTMLAAVATIGDMMPLWHENRILVRKGLQLLNTIGYRPLQLLLEREGASWDETLISFQIVPKFNVIGRLADRANVNNMVRYLLATNLVEQENFAMQIKALNNLRKTMSDSMSAIAFSKLNDDAFNIVEDPSFHEGIVGLIAGKILSETNKPTCILTETETSYKGSIRSNPGFDVHDFFQDFSDLLLRFGGHGQAAGIEILKENYEAFVLRVQTKMKGIILDESANAQEVIPLEHCDITLSGLKEVLGLKPFGQGFSNPEFEISDIPVLKTQTVGKSKYPKWSCKINGYNIEAISFKLNGMKIEKTLNSLHVIGTLNLNQFAGKETIQILISSLQ